MCAGECCEYLNKYVDEFVSKYVTRYVNNKYLVNKYVYKCLGGEHPCGSSTQILASKLPCSESW